MHLIRPALAFVVVVTGASSCIGSIADYDTLELDVRRGNFTVGEDFLTFSLSTNDDACISTPDLEARVDDVEQDVSGGGGDPCAPPGDRLTVVLDGGAHTVTLDEGEQDMEAAFSLPDRPLYDDGATIVQGKTVVLPDAIHRAPDALEATIVIGAGEPIALAPVVEGSTIRLPIPDGLVDGEPQPAILSVKATYRDEDVDVVDDANALDDADLDLVEEIGIQVTLREKGLLDDLLDIILGT